MIERYTVPEITKIWEDDYKFSLWLKIELLVCEAYSRLGIIPSSALERIKKNATYGSVEKVKEIEKETKHDVVAFVKAVGESIGQDARYLHLGLTSSDLLDTTLSLQLKESGDIILRDLENTIEIVREKAKKYRDLTMIGRTHGVHAEPITFGFKLAGWIAELERNKKRLISAIEEISVGKISGAVGTYAEVPPEVEAYVCEKLGLKNDTASTQVISRDRYAFFLATLAILGSSLERFATEIRHMARTEVREVEEGFSKGQRGSSAMPHKKNPITAEQICGLARVLRSNLIASLENIALWHERDISHSSVERIIMPDSTILASYLLRRFAQLVKDLVIYPENIERNLRLTGGLYNSQRVLLALMNKGLPRDTAYEIVQRNALKAWNLNRPFYEILLEDGEVRKYLTEDELKSCFNDEEYKKNLGVIYRRVGIDNALQ
ncbi:MAG: adenylosuccinate lyase [bacterium]